MPTGPVASAAAAAPAEEAAPAAVSQAVVIKCRSLPLT
jgi:hypothetical protein